MTIETHDPQAGTLTGAPLEEARQTRPADVWRFGQPSAHDTGRARRQRYTASGHGTEQWPDTIATDFGSGDALGDDQAERHSNWGYLPDCAPEGGKHREPSGTVQDTGPSAWFVVAVALCCAAVLIGSLLAEHMAWPLG